MGALRSLLFGRPLVASPKPLADILHVLDGRNVCVSLKRHEYSPVVRSRLEIIMADDMVDKVLCAIQTHAHTGKPGDGRIFVIPIETTVVIRTGERGTEEL